MTEDIEIIEAIDSLRCEFRKSRPDPLTGGGCHGRRVEVNTPVEGLPRALIPLSMCDDPEYTDVQNDSLRWRILRCRHDFEFWAFSCVTIKYKNTWQERPFVLNGPQRRLLDVLERDRLADEPLRLILLKARQWGGSTFIQMYMAWIQICHRRNWNSVIIAHVKDTSATIRGMYTKLLANYPADLWTGDEPPKLMAFEGSQNIRRIAGRQCTVAIGSSQQPDSIRGSDFAMAHLSEAAYWPSTPTRSPNAVIASVCGSVPLLPYSFVAVESTANGVGDYFHNEWLRSKSGEGDKEPIFVPWYEIDHYHIEGGDRRAILLGMDDEQWRMWRNGADTEAMTWLRRKRREVSDPSLLASEFPSDDTEAFCSNSSAVFNPEKVEAMRHQCTSPASTGEVSAGGGSFVPDHTGHFALWKAPEKGHRYVVSVDVGGRSSKADFSVIAVLDATDKRPEVVGQWYGHADHDILARKCIDVAQFYNRALLVIESNTFETDNVGGNADSHLFILRRVADAYPNVYRRKVYDSERRSDTFKIGFHTNRLTKSMLVNGLIEAVREGLYIERDHKACNEFITYEQRANGSYGAKSGLHDDILMTRALALHIIAEGAVPAPVASDYRPSPNWW